MKNEKGIMIKNIIVMQNNDQSTGRIRCRDAVFPPVLPLIYNYFQYLALFSENFIISNNQPVNKWSDSLFVSALSQWRQALTMTK